MEGNNNNQTPSSGQANNAQQSPVNHGTASWPSINTSTSANMNRLQIGKSEEFQRLVKKFAFK